MKNLKVYQELFSQLELQSPEELVLFSAFDIERSRLFFASSTNCVYTVQLNSSQKEGMGNNASLNAGVEPIDLEPEDCISSLDYLMEKEALVVGTLNGFLLLHIGDGNAAETVGRVEGGVKQIVPSPDGSLLAVVTGFGQILVMTPDWEVLYETTLEDIPEGVDVSDPTSCHFESTVSWRGDGKYFATLSQMQNYSHSQAKIKIWERDSGTLHASSELKAFVGTVMDWMPSGAKVAAVYDRKAEEKPPTIVFFEKNGLERNSFDVNGPVDGNVEMLKWNCSSDLLGAIVRYERYDAVKIWSFSNYHWYLKQEMRYSRKDGVRFMWDPLKPLRLICWTLSGKIITYNFIWVTAVMDNSTAIVIDDSKILITPLALLLMPPPMCLFSLKFPSAVCDVAFLSKNRKNHLVAYLSDGSLCVAELPVIDSWEEFEGKEISIEASCSEMTFGSLRHLVWLDSHALLGVSYLEPGQINNNTLALSPLTKGKDLSVSNGGQQVHILQEIDVLCSEDHLPGLITSSGWRVRASCQLTLGGSVVAIASNPVKGCSAFVEFDGGEVYEYASKLGTARASPERCLQRLDYDIKFSSSCPWMSVIPINEHGNLKALPFGLDSNNRIHVCGRILCDNCSSFSFYSDSSDQFMTHLILTTKQDLLFIIEVVDVLHGNLEAKYGNFVCGMNKRKEENRNCINIWERGAKVLGVLHGDEAAVVLQTSRGNLECIYPRKLVLGSIFNALVQQRFRDALLMVRRHRIDFNVIVDCCGWKLFLQMAAKFVAQVDNLTYITEFVCSMKNENVLETLYKNVVSLNCLTDTKYTLGENFKDCDAKGKVSSILFAIRTALEEEILESPARELCILTTLARSEPPALEEALRRIKVIREKEISGLQDPSSKSHPSAEEALKHLLWLSDSEAAYETALGLYDLNLAAIVALNSQKDPKEFLPFLRGLEQMPPAIMQYNIDLQLKRHEKALRHLASAGEAYYESCMNLMKSIPVLFPLGLQLFTEPARRSQVLEAWGDHLFGEKSFEEAANSYLCCSSLEKALKAYRACGDWKGALTVGGLLKLSKQDVQQLANELYEELQALGKPAEAAQVALEYCGDIEGAVRCYVSAREWEEALRIALREGKENLVTEVENAATNCATTLMGEYEEGIEKVGKYLTRYLAVRQRRLVLAAKLKSEDKTVNDVEDDATSQTSSSFSEMSAYTTGSRRGSGASISSNATSKGRRQRHKGGKIRAGSPGEEMALVEYLKGMSLTIGAQRELKTLLVTLLMLGKEDIARKLQRLGGAYQLSQIAAVKLAEDTISNENIDEKAHTLDHYIEKIRVQLPQSDMLSWQSKVLLSR